ncbi:Vacuolar cation-chloride cotransporter 1 [Sphaceloma murrayae]|uniref:Vacuolar cation-chloride cotransporter 1 n=1 Tax=Sphaceloma murrayae TaxID=2082308 RepID=A0A2K1QSU8_9PEZI|nr:Vacuolar cation-chloride cotransporter 1 [Sphaceloma murrayae]
MPTVLVVGATRGLGLELAKQYTSTSKVYGTARSSPPTSGPSNINWIEGIDLMKEDCGTVLASRLQDVKLDVVLVSAGVFTTESFDKPSWKDEVTMYTTSSIAPVFLVHHLVKAGNLRKGSKVLLLSSEAGSITLRHESEGGGNYAHHASKAALNMVGKLLSLDLKDKDIAVGLLHPGFMRTEMTKGVGFDKYWDDGGAVTPAVAAGSLIEFIETFDMSKTGTYWAPRGPGDIGTAEPTIGSKDKLPTPLQLPW